MKEQYDTAILPPLPIVGTLELTTFDQGSLRSITVVEKRPSDRLTPFFADCHRELHAFLSGDKRAIDLPLDLRGLSPFQWQVLREMRKIPYGEVSTYKDLAAKLGSKAYQAVGSACGRNPLMLIYPCHRVLGSKDLGGFAHGLEMKRALLDLERSRSSAPHLPANSVAATSSGLRTR